MMAAFNTFGRPWRPVMILLASYGATAVAVAAIDAARLVPSQPLQWAFAGTAAPALAVTLAQRASAPDRIKLGAIAFALYGTAVVIVAVPTVRDTLTSTDHVVTAIAQLDLIFVAAFVAGAACIGLIARLLYDGDEAFTRPWASVLGDARWMTMREAKDLFPPDGKVVIGEAYQPWKERRGTQDLVPGMPNSWEIGRASCRERV